MTKENKNKVLIFWSLILVITFIFVVLFIIRVIDTRLFESYDDIEKAKLNLVVDITSEEGEYFVYVYSAKKDDNGKLIDTASSDVNKAVDVLPTVLNYFNYVRRNERGKKNDSDLQKIYGYNVKNNAKDSNLDADHLDVKLSQLPMLVKIKGGNGVVDKYITANDIEKTLNEIMTK